MENIQKGYLFCQNAKKKGKGWGGGRSPPGKTLLLPPPPPASPGLESHLSMFVEGKAPCFVGSISAALSGRARAYFPNSGWYSSLPALKLIKKLVLLSKPITGKSFFTCVFLPSTSVTLMHFPRVVTGSRDCVHRLAIAHFFGFDFTVYT